MKQSTRLVTLVMLLLWMLLALPAAAAAPETTVQQNGIYTIYFETGGGVGIPVIASTTSTGRLNSLPTPHHIRLYLRRLIYRSVGKGQDHCEHRVRRGHHDLCALGAQCLRQDPGSHKAGHCIDRRLCVEGACWHDAGGRYDPADHGRAVSALRRFVQKRGFL